MVIGVHYVRVALAVTGDGRWTVEKRGSRIAVGKAPLSWLAGQGVHAGVGRAGVGVDDPDAVVENVGNKGT